VVAEVKSLKRRFRQHQKPTPLLQRGFRKRASSNPDQDGSRKRRRAAQLEENQLPDITASSQVDTDMIEDSSLLPPLPPVATDTDRQSRFIERSRGVMEMRWMTGRRDGGFHFDGRDDDEDREKDEEDEDEENQENQDGDEENRDEDEEHRDEDEEHRDEEDVDEEDEDEEDEEDEDEEDEDEDDEDEEDEDEDDEDEEDSEIPGISNWDLLGEDFEREAAALGSYSSRMSYLPS
jgi:hypothetical protein